MARKDLTKQKFNHWTVLYLDEERTESTGRSYWICQCECGTIKSVAGRDLKNGKSKSCGRSGGSEICCPRRLCHA